MPVPRAAQPLRGARDPRVPARGSGTQAVTATPFQKAIRSLIDAASGLGSG